MSIENFERGENSPLCCKVHENVVNVRKWLVKQECL